MGRFRIFWLCAIALMLAGVGCVGRADPAQRPAGDSGEGRLVMLLQAEHGAPSSAELEAVAPPEDLARQLTAIAEDEAAPPLARNRALYALARYPSAEGSRLLARIAVHGATPFARRLAARVMGRLPAKGISP